MAKKITALYERLSHDDEHQGESFSISNQKKLLETYATEHGLTPYVHFFDDGISGTRFDRPGFMDMMQRIEEGQVDTVIIKDMSRLGRDYLVVGQLQEMLRQKGVRLIAINDNHDSANGDDDFVVFRNLMNEWYAKDTSKKIRSTFQTKGKSGKHVASICPYGYLKDERDGNIWHVDPLAADIVRKIYAWTIDGMGPYQIAKRLKEEKVEIPAVHMARYNQGLNRKKPVKDPYGWGSSTVVGILKKREYLGHTVNFKTRKHFKDKKSHYVPEGEWLIFENTQEAIIDQDTFDKVQKIRSNVRRYPDGWGEVHALTGLMYCADCGAKMYVHRTSNGKRIAQYTCSAYTKVPCGTLCPTQHRVNESVILELIKEILKAIANYADEDREAFLNTIQDAQSEHMSTDVARKKSRYQAINSRLDELEKLICRIYEDNILGKLPDDRYFVLDRQYGKEREELEAERSSLKLEIDQFEKHANSAEKFAALIDKYENFDELTPTMINEFIDKILVHERDRKGSIDCRQEIEIYFSFIGRYIPPHFGEVNMTPEEEDAYRKKEAKKDRLHQNYLKRKAKGEIKAYEERTKDKYDARLDKIHEMKDQIRQEDIAKGIFIPVSMMEPQIPTVATPQ